MNKRLKKKTLKKVTFYYSFVMKEYVTKRLTAKRAKHIYFTLCSPLGRDFTCNLTPLFPNKPIFSAGRHYRFSADECGGYFTTINEKTVENCADYYKRGWYEEEDGI